MMVSEKTLQEDIIEKAWTDEQFRQQLLSNPKQALREAFGITIPDHIKVRTVEEQQNDYVLVIPPNPAKVNYDVNCGPWRD
ncbi:NHLP leader peptide family RiPP precursor [Paenibacillus sp.]|uniref:NHLP leader peptide family RiPP precursor n=1 Tax=Paenibacillus sp. TaxID=58172 RepID=UPI00344E32A8